MTTAILLASGFSKRMGCDKLLLDYMDKPLAMHVMEAIRCSRVDARIIVTNTPQLAELAAGFEVVPNPSAHEGRSAAVRTGVLAAAYDSMYMFFVADQPLITAEAIDGIITMANENPYKIITASANGRRGNPVLFPSLYRSQLLELNADTGGRELITPENTLGYQLSPELLNDIDAPIDYEILLLNTGKRPVTKTPDVHTI